MAQAPDVKGGGPEVIGMGSDDGNAVRMLGAAAVFRDFFRCRKNTLLLCRATRTAFFSREVLQNVI